MTNATTPVSFGRPNLTDRARELGPILRDRCDATNELRRLPDTTWNDLIRSGILRALQPKRWGGGEVDLKEFYSVVSESGSCRGLCRLGHGNHRCASLANRPLFQRSTGGGMGE